MYDFVRLMKVLTSRKIKNPWLALTALVLACAIVISLIVARNRPDEERSSASRRSKNDIREEKQVMVIQLPGNRPANGLLIMFAQSKVEERLGENGTVWVSRDLCGSSIIIFQESPRSLLMVTNINYERGPHIISIEQSSRSTDIL
jgi:hypothetical protein